jgi:hypothetical protein
VDPAVVNDDLKHEMTMNFFARSNSSNNLLRTFCFGLAKDETRQTAVLVARAQ